MSSERPRVAASAASLAVDDDLELLNRLRTLFTNARNHRRVFYDRWRRNYNLVNNRWGQDGNNNPRDSEIYPTLASIAAWMTDQNTSVDVSAACDPNSDYARFMQAIARDLATVLQTNWTVENEKAETKMVVWDAFQYGAGFYKAIWDQSLAGNLGNSKAIRVDPWALYLDPTATSLRDCEYMIEVRSMSLAEVERRWPGHSTALEASLSSFSDSMDDRPTQGDNPSRIPKANPGAFNGVAGTRWANPNGSRGPDGDATLPSVVVYEFWIKENDEYWESDLEDDDTGLTLAPGEKLKDKNDKDETDDEKHVAVRWRVCVTAANQILMDEWADDLYSSGDQPYERYVWEETGEMYGIALVDHLAHPQIALNRLLTSLQQNAELIGNPIFLEAANSGLDRVNVINKPGQRLRLSGTGAMQNNRPDWLRPPEMPAFVQQLVEFWIGRIENTSGLMGAMKGGAQPSRTPEGVVSTIQEAAFVRIRSALANLEMAISNVSYKLADLIIDNYTEPRVMAIVGPDGAKQTSLALAARHFIVPTHKGAAPLKYSLLIQAGASSPTSRQARVAEADMAYSLGIIDRQAWMEAHSYPNYEEVLKRVNEQITAGEFNPPGARQRAQH